MLSKIISKIKSTKGVTMLETCAMLFFIFAFFGLLFTGGQMVSNKNTLNYATQVAAREASLQPNSSKALSIAKQRATDILKANGIATNNISVSVNSYGAWTKGNDVEVKVSTTYDTLFPMPNSDGETFSTQNRTMASRVVVMIESK